VSEYVGGYDDWLLQSRRKAEAPATAAAPRSGEKRPAPAPVKEKPRKLTFKEQKEFGELPARIEALETEQRRIQADLADPDFYRLHGEKVAGHTARLATLEKELALAYGRWEELDALSARS
jgi:ATP-binding cassette subfamily F protein uup